MTRISEKPDQPARPEKRVSDFPLPFKTSPWQPTLPLAAFRSYHSLH